MSGTTLNERIRKATSRDTYQTAKVIEKLTNNIYEIMECQGMSQSDLADRLGTTRAWINKLLQGDHNMTIKTAVSVVHALGYDLEYKINPKSSNHANYKVNYSQKSVIQSESLTHGIKQAA